MCPEAAQRADVGDRGGGGGGRPEPGGQAGAAAVHDHPARALQGAGQTRPLKREKQGLPLTSRALQSGTGPKQIRSYRA